MIRWEFADNNIEIEQGLEGVPASVLRIMKRRGVDEDSFADFISETPKNTYDPFLTPDLKECCERLLFACENKLPICVYGDYDADGVTSTTLMVSLLKKFNSNISYYIPSRFEDGYGPNKAAFKKIADRGCKMLVTVDCGITSKDEIEYAKSLGMECIVTDHHILRDDMTPDCLTVNPHRADSKYPFADLSGCGVVFKIAQGIERMREDFSKRELNSFLDLVAISTVADVVPLLDENRTLVKYGLERLNRRERMGIRVLLDELDLPGSLVSSDISFTIAPNINALGRIDRADKGVELLLSEKSVSELRDLASEIVQTNKKRKAIQEETASICRAALEGGKSGEFAPVIYAPGSHEGVAGIVAGSLKEELGRPVCIVSPGDDGVLKGTGRSVPGINLHTMFENCGDVFDRFGGHAGACGFTVKKGKLDEFRNRLQELVQREYDEDPSVFDKSIVIEKELSYDEKNIRFAESLRLLEPYGEANPVPVFCIREADVKEYRCIGSNGKHLKFTVRTPDGIDVQCISFGGSEKYLGILKAGLVDVAGEVSINEFRGKKQLQVRVVDVKVSI